MQKLIEREKKRNLIKTETKCSFRRALWKSAILLQNLGKESLVLEKDLKDQIHDEMWRNLIAEYDATHLSNQLRESTQRYSDEFLEFEAIWLLDELNHYQGLLKIYCAIYNLDEHQVHEQVRSRKADFGEVNDILHDEFMLCVCFAYDELASTRGYAEAFPLYDSFKVPTVSKWIRLASRDEWYHSLNAQEIIKIIHPNKREKVPEVLKFIVERDQNRKQGYQGTFLFDHDYDPENNPFNADFLKKCANDICRFLSAPLAFQGSY